MYIYKTTDMIQSLKALPPKPDNLSSISRIQEKTDSHNLSSDIHIYVVAYTQLFLK